MSSQTFPPPPAREPAPAPTGGGWRTWHLAVAVVGALVVGIGLGAAGTGGDDPDVTAAAATSDTDTDAAAAAEVQELEAQVEELRADLTERDEDLAEAQAAVLAIRDQITQTEDRSEPAPESADVPDADPAAASGDDGTYAAGSYRFADVQVRQDFVDDFEVRTRMTNDGEAQQFVSLTVTLFSGGSVVGTASGSVSDVEPGETLTVEFISFDDFTEWDELEFQVDSEF